MISNTWIQMGMPITVSIRDETAGADDIAAVAAWFEEVNQRYSTYLETSEVSRLNAGVIDRGQVSDDFESILRLCEQTTAETNGYFDIVHAGYLDPSGLVKGWAIQRASDLLTARGYFNHVVDAGGDIQAVGVYDATRPWTVGIRNPFDRSEVVKVLSISNCGVATSGTAIRGQHIYDPWHQHSRTNDLISLTVVGPSIFDADRFATAAFAMGFAGLNFISDQPNLEAYAIASNGLATYTSGFNHYVQ
ncbi:FAD:protein FMN transferase [soil metagenome]